MDFSPLSGVSFNNAFCAIALSQKKQPWERMRSGSHAPAETPAAYFCAHFLLHSLDYQHPIVRAVIVGRRVRNRPARILRLRSCN